MRGGGGDLGSTRLLARRLIRATAYRRGALVLASALMSATLTGLTGAIPASAHVGGPSVYGLTPNSGSAAGKTDVQIFGSGFFNVQSVSFGTVQVFNFFA